MIEDRPLILGCDDHSLLPVVLEKLSALVNQNYILVTRSSDLMKIIKSSNPLLVIIRFRDNQQVIRRVSHQFNDIKIPILCLLKRFEYEYLHWNEQDIVFTHSIESPHQINKLSSRIKSLLLLIKNSRKTRSEREQNRSIRSEFVSKNGELARYILELDHKNRSLLKIKKRIKNLYCTAEGPVKKSLLSIVNSIQTGKKDGKIWKDFKLYFENVNPNFIKQLSSMHPGLTPMDIKYCCFLKMNLSTDEIRHVLGISQESVRTHKYRLKKKLDLSKEEDLMSYIISFPKTNMLQLA